MTIFLDLFKYHYSFKIGSVILLITIIFASLSFISPYEPDDKRVVKRNKPPSVEYILGTNSNGQDIFWMMTYAIRNSLLIALIAVFIGRGIGVIVGLMSGYIGGTFDRISSTIVDSLMVIPRLPLLILICAILRGEISIFTIGFLLGILDWAPPSKRYRSQILSLREREFTFTGVYSGMSSFQIVMKEHLPFLIPFLLADCVSGFLFAISFEVTLAILGLGDLSAQTLGTMIYWANYYQALLSDRVWIVTAPIIASILIVIGLYLVSISTSSYLDPRSRLERITYKE